MKDSLLLSAFVLACLSTLLAKITCDGFGKKVDAGGPWLRMQISGQGGPAVVFECFGYAPAEAWVKVKPEVSRFARTVAYDHAGHWGSETGPKPRDARQIARELRTALHNAGIPPPYVLVGHSFGGPYSRVFAGMFPDEVAGLVLVDPTQEESMEWLKIHFPNVNKITANDLAKQEERGCSWESLSQAHAAWPLPDIPVVLLTGMRIKASKPENIALVKAFKPIWLKNHRAWLEQIHNSRHIVTTNSGHGIPLDEPQLVIEAIREVVGQVRSRKFEK